MTKIASGRVEFLQNCIVDAYQRGVFLGLKESDLKVVFSEALSDFTIKETIYNYNKIKSTDYVEEFLEKKNKGNKLFCSKLLDEFSNYNPYKIEKTMKQKVKELRVQIDGLATLTKGLEPLDNCIILDDRIGINKNSIQINKATDSLFLAKAWLGKVLGELGEDSPYPRDGTRKTVEDIEPTADTGERIASAQIFWKKANHIEKVDWLRQEISKIVGEADILMSQKGRVYIFGCNINKHLSEARFHLGFELERVREDENN